jgi:hypothetical protein
MWRAVSRDPIPPCAANGEPSPFIFSRAAGFVEWAKKQIEHFADLFKVQVYGSDVDPKTVNEALRITYAQSKKVLMSW